MLTSFLSPFNSRKVFEKIRDDRFFELSFLLSFFLSFESLLSSTRFKNRLRFSLDDDSNYFAIRDKWRIVRGCDFRSDWQHEDPSRLSRENEFLSTIPPPALQFLAAAGVRNPCFTIPLKTCIFTWFLRGASPFFSFKSCLSLGNCSWSREELYEKKKKKKNRDKASA